MFQSSVPTMLKLITLLRRIYVSLRSTVYILYFSKVYKVQFGNNVRIYSKLLINGRGSIIIGDGTVFSSRRAVNELNVVSKDAVIEIGKGCLLNGAIIGCAKSMKIGDNCIIAEAYIRDTSSHGIEPEKRRNPEYAKIVPVYISENVWIGNHTHVIPGVTIGKNSIIGVNSVVVKSIRDNVFAAGVPCRVIKEI